jgi:hypothetical protein
VLDAGENQTTLTALKTEFDRVAIGARWMSGVNLDIATLAATFGLTDGVGTWKELGIFNAASQSQLISSCDVTTGWSSGTGCTLSAETTIKREGVASLKSTVTAPGGYAGSHRFLKSTLGGSGAGFSEDTAYLQYWHYLPETRFHIWSILFGNNSNNYWGWYNSISVPGPAWILQSLKLSTAGGSGNPVLSSPLKYFMIYDYYPYGSPLPQGWFECIDNLRLYTPGVGDMFARYQPEIPIAKELGVVKTAILKLRIK